MINKEVLRKKYKTLRKSIQNKENKSLIITNKIVNHSKFKTTQIVALYMNNEDEVITKYIIEECFNQHFYFFFIFFL